MEKNLINKLKLEYSKIKSAYHKGKELADLAKGIGDSYGVGAAINKFVNYLELNLKLEEEFSNKSFLERKVFRLGCNINC